MVRTSRLSMTGLALVSVRVVMVRRRLAPVPRKRHIGGKRRQRVVRLRRHAPKRQPDPIGNAMLDRVKPALQLKDSNLFRQQCYINGQWVDADDKSTLTVYNPADGSLVGTVPLAMAYAAGFALAWPHASPWLRVFVAPGRMALTNYLTHSVLGVLLFYGVGLGWVGRLPVWGIYAYAVALFAIQAVFSRWWLSRHAQGPMEALWRRWTYGNTAMARPASDA